MKNYLVRYYAPDGRVCWARRKAIGRKELEEAVIGEGVVPSLILPDFLILTNKTANSGLTDTQAASIFRDLGNMERSTGSVHKALGYLNQALDKNIYKFKYKSPLKNALYVLRAYFFRKRNSGKIKFIRTAKIYINSGRFLSEAIHELEFDEFVQSLIRVGEQTGELSNSLKQISGYFESKRGYKKDFLSALAYPAFLFVLLFVSAQVFIYFVVPSFALFFKNFPHIPAQTLFVINLFANLRRFMLIYVVLAVSVITFLGFIWISNWGNIRTKIFNRIAKIPVLGYFFRFNYLRWYFYQFSVLIKAGLTYPAVLDYFRSITKNEYFKDKWETVYANLMGGRTLTESLSAADVLRPEDLDSVHSGEQSGLLDETALMLSGVYGEISETQIKRITKALEALAVMIVIVFLIVMFSCVMMPMIKGEISIAGGF